MSNHILLICTNMFRPPSVTFIGVSYNKYTTAVQNCRLKPLSVTYTLHYLWWFCHTFLHYYYILIIFLLPDTLMMVTRVTETCSWRTIIHDWVNLKMYNVNKNPTRCNSMQIFIYCKATLHVSGVALSSFAVNKYLHTVASGWIFINIELRRTEPWA